MGLSSDVVHSKLVQHQHASNILPISTAYNDRSIRGTGVTSILLFNLPYQFPGLKIIATVICVLNVVLFITFTVLSIVRYSIWPKLFSLMVTHSTQLLFLGTFCSESPILDVQVTTPAYCSFLVGFSTVVTMTAYVCIPAFGHNFLILTWILWWMNAVVSLLISIGVAFAMFNFHHQSLE